LKIGRLIERQQAQAGENEQRQKYPDGVRFDGLARLKHRYAAATMAAQIAESIRSTIKSSTIRAFVGASYFHLWRTWLAL
jgi:hypothetical protein